MGTGEIVELAVGDPAGGKGVWDIFANKTQPPRVRISCPECGFVALIDHEVDQYGVVTPSVVCPAKGCKFHRMIRLTDWSKK